MYNSFSDIEQILIDEFVNRRKLHFICYLRKGGYFYGWFEDDLSETADSVYMTRINLDTHKIEQANVLIAPIKWNINYGDFVDIKNGCFDEL